MTEVRNGVLVFLFGGLGIFALCFLFGVLFYPGSGIVSSHFERQHRCDEARTNYRIALSSGKKVDWQVQDRYEMACRITN